MQETSSDSVIAELKSLWELTHDKRVTEGWSVLLLLFTAAVGSLTLPGHVSLPSYIALVFYVFVPGYSFVQSFLARTSRFEKLFTSIFFSIAFLMGTKAIDRTITLQSNSSVAFLPSSPFEFGLVFSLTTILLVYTTWKAFRLSGAPPRRYNGTKGTNSNQRS
jgi:hypothetical protein